MKARTRRARAILRDRRLDNRDRDELLDLTPIIGPITGWELFMIHRYGKDTLPGEST